jgi:small-conductance mechanosensitive channel
MTKRSSLVSGRTWRVFSVFALVLLSIGLQAHPSFAEAPSASATARAASSAATASAPRPSAGPQAAASGNGARSTPRRSLTGFLRAAELGELDRASEHLDVRGLPRGRDRREARELASMLYRVITWHVSLDPSEVSDEPDAAVPSSGLVLDVVELEGETYTIALTPVRLASGETAWLFSKSTVASIRSLFEANERRWLEERVPDALKERALFGLRPWQWLGIGLLVAIALVVGRIGGSLVSRIALRIARTIGPVAERLALALDRPARLALGLGLFMTAIEWLLLPAAFAGVLARGASIGYVVSLAWAAIVLVREGTASWEERLPDDTDGDIEHRGLRTRLAMLRRIATALISLLGLGAALMQFEVVRTVGVSLLASAGIAGVLVGFAAQRTLGGIIDGIAMSLTQPLRIGDVVKFQAVGEPAFVEHIYFTYVVLRIWDGRRVIVPVTKVMADPFENWTRSRDELFATVDVFVDPAAPIESVRATLHEACTKSPHWDGGSCSVVVADVTETAVVLRAVVSLARLSQLPELKSDLRERCITALQAIESGRYLPYRRVETVAPREPRTPAS